MEGTRVGNHRFTVFSPWCIMIRWLFERKRMARSYPSVDIWNRLETTFRGQILQRRTLVSYMPRVVAMDGVCGSLHHPVGPNHGGGGGMLFSTVVRVLFCQFQYYQVLFKKTTNHAEHHTLYIVIIFLHFSHDLTCETDFLFFPCVFLFLPYIILLFGNWVFTNHEKSWENFYPIHLIGEKIEGNIGQVLVYI